MLSVRPRELSIATSASQRWGLDSFLSVAGWRSRIHWTEQRKTLWQDFLLGERAGHGWYQKAMPNLGSDSVRLLASSGWESTLRRWG
jgi:hypothetical protein